MIFRQRPSQPRRVSPRQASYLSCSHKKRNPKNAARLPASLRFAPGKPASRNSVCGAAQLAARLRRFAQTNGGKSEHEATLSCGSVARRLNRVPQARPDGWDRAARQNCDEIGLKSRQFVDSLLSIQHRSYPAPVFGFAPCAHACDGKLLGLAAAQQSAAASRSDLRPFV